MKRTIRILTKRIPMIALLAVAYLAFSAQTYMTIQKSDGTNAEYRVADIDSIWFQEVEEFDIVNKYDRSYLEDTDYSADTTYAVSHIFDKDAEGSYKYHKKGSDTPEPVIISWEGTASKLIMSTVADFTILPDAQRMAAPAELALSESPQKVYNLVPGVKYYYKVLDANSNVIKAGCVRPYGPLRMIKISSSVENVRDLGGWKTQGGGHIAYGRIYRGANIDRISDKGKNIFLQDLNISLDMDLRGIKDSESGIKQVVSGADYLIIPVEKNLGQGTGNTQELYQTAIRTIIQYLGQGKNVYFHCAGGADRTGTLAFLIEALVGVSESDMSKDYELTTFAGTNKRARNYGVSDDSDVKHVLYQTITHLRKFGDPKKESIQELAVKWATTRHSDNVDPITMEEIEQLRKYLVVK